MGPIAVGDIGSIELVGDKHVGPGSRTVGTEGIAGLPIPTMKPSPELCTVHTRDPTGEHECAGLV